MIVVPVLISGGDPLAAPLAAALGASGVPCLVVGGDAPQPADARPDWRLFGFERFDSHVTAHVAALDGERQQQVRAAILVGCDGADSRVRHFLDLDPPRPGEVIRGRGRVWLAGAAAGAADAGSDGVAALAAAIAADLAAAEDAPGRGPA